MGGSLDPLLTKLIVRHLRAFEKIVADFPAAHYFNAQGHKKSRSNQDPFTPMNASSIQLMVGQR